VVLFPIDQNTSNVDDISEPDHQKKYETPLLAELGSVAALSQTEIRFSID
jgi:hypothetical protein